MGYGHRGKLFYLQYIWTESRQREGRELFRYCYFHFIVMNHSRRCFGPNHASLMQIERNSVTALRLEYRSNLFSVNLWTQDVFTVSVSFIFYTDCWTASFANYQENEAWVKIEAIILVSINNAFVNRITVVYLRVFLLGTNIIRCLSENETFRCSFWTKTVFFHTSLFLFHNPVTYCEANIQLQLNEIALWCCEKSNSFHRSAPSTAILNYTLLLPNNVTWTKTCAAIG